MKKFLLLFCAVWMSSSLISQNSVNAVDYWFDASEAAIAMPVNAERTIIPDNYRTLALDLASVKVL
jgi:cellobiose-specific phosphotransferase system component IIB